MASSPLYGGPLSPNLVSVGSFQTVSPRTWVNKPLIDAPNPFGWHYSCEHGHERTWCYVVFEPHPVGRGGGHGRRCALRRGRLVRRATGRGARLHRQHRLRVHRHLAAAGDDGCYSSPVRFAQGTLRSSGDGALPDCLPRPGVSNGCVNPQRSGYLSATCLSGLRTFRRASHLGVTRSDRWHGAPGKPFRSIADTARVVRGSAYGREPTWGVVYDDTLGGPGRRVRTRQSVPGIGRRALCGSRLLHLPSGRRTNRATCKSAV